MAKEARTDGVPRPREAHLVEAGPGDYPGLVSFWRFAGGGEEFVAGEGEPYRLVSQTGVLGGGEDPEAPWGGAYLDLREGDWLRVPRGECPGLDIHGRGGEVTVLAWIRRRKTVKPQCEFLAGQWNETAGGRQYGLFLNIRVWGESDRVFGHLSHVGGPTPGYRYCMDGPMGATAVPWDQWSVVGMSYDGHQGYAWYNGLLDICPGVNPYPLSGGLHDGGPEGSDFTVGGVHRSGEMGNFFCGGLAGLAVYRRALSPAEIYALSLSPKLRAGPAKL